MVKSKNDFFNHRDNKTPHDKSVSNDEELSEDIEISTEKMSEPVPVNTAEMEDKVSPGSEMEENTDNQETESPQSAIETVRKLQLKIEELQDRYVRLMAEFDNYRKRTLKEKMEIIKSAGEDILINILPIKDDFERGLQVMENSPDIDSLKLGIQLIYNKFNDFLIQRGVKEMECLHQDFNVELQEALTKIPAPDKALKGKILDVIQKGYFLNDKVIRYAKVIVGE